MKCDNCGREMTTARTCHMVPVLIGGEDFSPLSWDGPGRCHDCNVQPGGYHHRGATRSGARSARASSLAAAAWTAATTRRTDMGLEYAIVDSKRKELDKVVCDRCGRSIEKESAGQWNPFGEPFSQYHEPHFKEDYFVLEQSWGYFSKKDGSTHQAVLCEPCYDIVFADVKIQVTEYM